MKLHLLFLICMLCVSKHLSSQELHSDPSYKKNPDFVIRSVTASHHAELSSLVMEIVVSGNAGNTYPQPLGALDGAPVLGYVFPTTLSSSDVGFGEVSGITALALTSHPDFDDTPLWDENNDTNYNNDGRIWHAHWVILVEDQRVSGGLSVKEIPEGDTTAILPPTNPGMPMYMDSPGFQVIKDQNTIKVLIPTYRINQQIDFQFDGVTAYMQVNTSLKDKPLLGVYEVYSVASKDLSLPYKVRN